jgi:nitrogen PTS system EIIA component
MRIADFLRQELVFSDLRTTRKPDVIRELAVRMAEHCPDIDAEPLIAVLREREKLGSTAVGEGIAIPHGKLDGVARLAGCLARSQRGIDFESEDGKPTHFFFLLVAPTGAAGDHLKALARISRLFKNPEFRSRLMKAHGAEQMYAIIEEEDASAR